MLDDKHAQVTAVVAHVTAQFLWVSATACVVLAEFSFVYGDLTESKLLLRL